MLLAWFDDDDDDDDDMDCSMSQEKFQIIQLVWLFRFYGVSTFAGYLTPILSICIYIQPNISERIFSW